MAAICPNCKTKLSCGCQRRTASNGATACSSCIGAYEKKLKTTSATPTGTARTKEQRFAAIVNKFKI